MIHRMLRYPAGWEWHVLQQAKQQAVRQEPLPSRKNLKQAAASQNEQIELDASIHAQQEQAEQSRLDIKRLFPECAQWLDECEHRNTNQINVEHQSSAGPLLYGTIMLQVSEQQTDVHPFHFWLSNKRLITLHEDMRIPLRLQSEAQTMKLDICQTAPEAFFVMLSSILESFHKGLDGFERRLGELEAIMRQENNTGLIDVIFERRYDLLHWSHLFIPVRELHGAAKEAFMDELTETDSFVRISHKLERIESLLKHYSLEIDTLISLDDAISNFRGNDIMKTLTIFTVLVLPATLTGSIWGTNFNGLPWKDHFWGFPLMMSITIAITAIIYIWLWKKGWTGDLLHGRKPQEIISGSKTSRSKRGKRTKASHKQSTSHAASAGSEQLQSRSRKNRP